MRIALLATGGTIACRQTPDGLSPALHAEELAKSIACRDGVTLLPVDVFSMDSSNIQPEEWTQLAHAVDRAMQDCDGVVITHGTDTMGYTAAALSYMLLGQTKPVILTGSQLPLGAPLSDAEINLSCAIEAACQGVAGTYVCFNRKLILGTRAVKTHTLSFDAFDSVNRSLSGMVDSNGQPVARVEHGIAAAPERTLLGRRVVLTNYLPAFSTSLKKTDVFAMIYNFGDYTLNTNFAVGIKTYEDNDTDDIVRKSIMFVDGKPIDYTSLVKLAGTTTA